MVILPMPPPVELERLLEALLGRGVKSSSADGPPGGRVAVALYESDPPVLGAAVLCDVSLAAALGSALSAVPPAVAAEAAARGELDGTLADNVAEVMNVLARHLVARSGRRFALRTFSCPPGEAPKDTLAAARESDEVRAYRLDVVGYGGGNLAFCTL